MSDDKKGYVAFLEASVPVDESGIGAVTPQELSEAVVAGSYDGMQKDVVGWDGKKGFPNISQDEKLNDVVDKILKRSPKEDGTKQPVDLNKTKDVAGIKDGKHVTEGDDEVKIDAGDKVIEVEPKEKEEKETPEDEEKEKEAMKEGADEDADATDDKDKKEEEDDDCPECDKKIQEIYSSLGISPLEMLEDEDESLQDLVGEDSLPDEDFELNEEETQILQSLISEMGVIDDDVKTEEIEESELLIDELDIELED